MTIPARILLALLAASDALNAYFAYDILDVERALQDSSADPASSPAWIPVLMMVLGLFAVAVASANRLFAAAICAAAHLGIFGRFLLDGEFQTAIPAGIGAFLFVVLMRQWLTGHHWPQDAEF